MMNRKLPLKVFIEIEISQKNAFSAIASNGIIFEKFQPIGV